MVLLVVLVVEIEEKVKISLMSAGTLHASNFQHSKRVLQPTETAAVVM